MTRMIVVIAKNVIRPEEHENARNVFREYTERCRKLPGVISADFTVSIDDPNTFYGIEEYEDMGILEAHGKSEVFHTMMGSIGQLLAETPSVHRYEVSDKNKMM